MFLRTRYGICLFITVLSGSLQAQWTHLSLDHWAYVCLERLQTRGLIESRWQTGPLSRRRIADMLAEADRRLAVQDNPLSRAERGLLEQLKGELNDAYRGTVKAEFNERHLLTWSEGKNTLSADAIVEETAITRTGQFYSPSQTSSLTRFGGQIRADLLGNFSILTSAWNTLLKGDKITGEQFNPSHGVPVVVSGGNAYSDDATAYLVWKLPWFSLQFGRDRAHWGPGKRGALMLAVHGGRFDMLRLVMPFKRFQFTWLHGKLHSGEGRKWIAAHRVEVKVFRWLILAGSESVVYGGRGAEPAYLNPVMPYHVAEHHLGDRDNNTLSVDMTLYPGLNMKAYAELFIDDYTSSENAFTYYGNKWAFLGGLYWVAPGGLAPLDLRIEYTRIEPYVYTHKDPVIPYTNYDHPLAHWLGPDSDDLIIEAGFLPGRRISASASFERIRRGEGRVDIPHDASMGKKKSFLSGVCETSCLTGISFSLQMLKDLFVHLSYSRLCMQNADHEPGRDTKDHIIRLKLTFNY